MLSKEFLRFSLVGGACFVLNLLVIYVATSIAGIHYVLSTVLALLIVGLFGYAANRAVTFKSQGKVQRELPRYYVIVISSFLVGLAGMAALVELFHVWYLLAAVIVSGILWISNFFAARYWAFKDRGGQVH